MRNADGSTPMMMAAYCGHSAVTRLLLLNQLRKGHAPAFCSPHELDKLYGYAPAQPAS